MKALFNILFVFFFCIGAFVSISKEKKVIDMRNEVDLMSAPFIHGSNISFLFEEDIPVSNPKTMLADVIITAKRPEIVEIKTPLVVKQKEETVEIERINLYRISLEDKDIMEKIVPKPEIFVNKCLLCEKT